MDRQLSGTADGGLQASRTRSAKRFAADVALASGLASRPLAHSSAVLGRTLRAGWRSAADATLQRRDARLSSTVIAQPGRKRDFSPPCQVRPSLQQSLLGGVQAVVARAPSAIAIGLEPAADAQAKEITK